MKTEQALLIDANTFAQLLGVSRSQFYKMRADGRLPAPIAMAGVKWRRSEVIQWIEAGCPSIASYDAASR